jgi:hypothetical protein
MTPALRTPGPASPSTWLGIAIGLVAVAASLKPFHVSSAVFWSVFGLGGVSLVAAAVLELRRLLPATTRRQLVKPNHPLASECRRVSAATAGIQAGLDHESIDADDQKARAAARNYRENYSVWALRVFDSAAAAGAIDDCSRSLIEAPTAAQLHIVRDVFRDAALGLEAGPRMPA